VTKPTTVAEYISTFPKEIQPVLEGVRRTIRKAAPKAEETISYGIPTFKLDGQYLVYFAGAKKHLSVYPFSEAMAQAFPEAAEYDQSGKGTIRFPLGQPMPLGLIAKIVTFRIRERQNEKEQKPQRNNKAIHQEIKAYNDSQLGEDKAICTLLAQEIDRHLPEAERKIWHRHPVWFLDGNPIVGYSKLKNCVRLLFWSGQSFDEPGLQPEGSFQAAEARYTSIDQVNTKDLKRWLGKARRIQWDYKNIVKRKGVLTRLK